MSLTYTTLREAAVAGIQRDVGQIDECAWIDGKALMPIGRLWPKYR